MFSFNWVFHFDPALPIHVFSYDVQGHRDKLHWHDYYEIGLCVNGSGRFIYVNKEYQVNKGDVFLTNNFENHVAVSMNNESTQYIFFIFMPSFIADPNGRQLDLEYLFPFHYNPMDFENRLPANTVAAKRLGELIKESLSIYTAKERFYEIELDIKLREILLEFSKHFIGQKKSYSAVHNYVSPKIQKAIQYMNLHFNEPLTIALIADIVDVSPSYFRHLFKESTRVSFKQYITHLRMSQAKKMLLSTDKSINEVIFDVGYNNITQFYKTFRRYTLMSPAEYRSQYNMLYEKTL